MKLARTIILRGLVEGEAKARLIVVRGPLSFYGEVDVEECRLYDGRMLRGRILVIRESRGSTVAPYIMYQLKKKGCAPTGIVAVKAEPMLVAGAVLAEIPLAESLPEKMLETLRDDMKALLRVDPPKAWLEIQVDET